MNKEVINGEKMQESTKRPTSLKVKWSLGTALGNDDYFCNFRSAAFSVLFKHVAETGSKQCAQCVKRDGTKVE